MDVIEQDEPRVEPLQPAHPERPLAPPIPCAPNEPISIYQVHQPSWMRVPDEQNRPLAPLEMAPKLVQHAKSLGFTHVQLHAPSYSEPEELRLFAAYLRQNSLGLILENPPGDIAQFGADGQWSDGVLRLGEHTYHWDVAWAEETLAYFRTDPLYRKSKQAQFQRRDSYAFGANYVLPLAQRFVAAPGASLVTMMPGDEWQKFANMRLLFAFMFLLPGKKLMFMGNEFGQPSPWAAETELDWHLAFDHFHGQLLKWVTALNRTYREQPPLHETDANSKGFQWVDTSDAENSVISFLRRGADGRDALLVALNFTPVPRHNYRLGVPYGGVWGELLNGDACEFGGSGQGNLGGVEASPLGWNYQSHSLMLTLPPLAAVVLKGTPQPM